MTDHHLTIDAGIATITFNRPEFLNAPTAAARLRYADLLIPSGAYTVEPSPSPSAS